MSNSNQNRGERRDEPMQEQGEQGQQREYSTAEQNRMTEQERQRERGEEPQEGRPIERPKVEGRKGVRGTAAMDPKTRQEVARKGGLAVSRNRQHMAEIGRKGGQTVSKNREHMAAIGRKGGEASRGHR